jgi:bcr-type benzoyl-CoA reductase subunit C
VTENIRVMENFRDAANRIDCRAIERWKAGGGKVAGYTCSYVPAEIFHAAGILPTRIRGIGTDNMAIGDAYFGPYICTFPKSVLQLAGEGRFSFFDGAVISPGCDSMRRLYDCWRKANEDYPGSMPGFFYYFNVPHKTAPHGIRWFGEEIRKLIRAVEGYYGVVVSEDDLRRSIVIYNRGRSLQAELQELRSESMARISGADAYAVAVAGGVFPREEYNRLLEELLAELRREEPPDAFGKKRLMAIGSISDDIALIRLLEQSAAVVVADNLCFGARYAGDEISLEKEPVQALAEGYLENSICPRMFGQYEKRLGILLKTIEKSRVEGVVMQNIRFCDLHGSENGLLERELESRGIPCLKLEREYGPLVEVGRIRMRVDAFLERIR